MFTITGTKGGKTIVVKCDKNLNITFNDTKNECLNDELNLLLRSPSGGTYCPEEKTELHIYLTLKESFFDEVLKEEIAELEELENEPQTVY